MATDSIRRMHEHHMLNKSCYLGHSHEVEMGMLYLVRIRRWFVGHLLCVSVITLIVWSKTDIHQLGARDLYQRQ